MAANLDLEKVAKNYKVFVDTCSLMHQGAEQFFSNRFCQCLQECGSQIIVPLEVIKELQRHAAGSDLPKKKLAERGLLILQTYQQMNLLRILGDENDPFPDNLFQSIFAKFRLKYNLCLITQDTALIKDIYQLRQSHSVQRIKNLVIICLTHDGRPVLPREADTNPGVIASPANSVPKRKPFKLSTQIVSTKPAHLKVASLPGDGGVVTDSEGRSHKLLRLLGAGGEASVYLTDGNLICKIYRREKITDQKRDKLTLMLSNPVEYPGICWPKALAYNKNREFVGYLMEPGQGKELQKCFFIKPVLLKSFPGWTRKNVARLAITVLEQIVNLHSQNVILGDINPLNIMVKSDSEVYLIDTDSFQIEGFPCPVGTVNFTAPEIQGKDFKTFLRTFQHEYFAVATLAFMIFLPGKPPYSQQGGSDPASNIKAMNFSYPFEDKKTGKVPQGPWRFMWSHLPYRLKEAFFQTFKNNQRLDPGTWLRLARDYLWHLDNGHFSDELFPTGFKIVDGIEVSCAVCGSKFELGRQFADQLKSTGKEFLCEGCRSIEVSCSACGSNFKVNRQFADQLKTANKSFLCENCRPSLKVTCSRCGGEFKMSPRLLDELQRNGKDCFCKPCRSSLGFANKRPSYVPYMGAANAQALSSLILSWLKKL